MPPPDQATFEAAAAKVAETAPPGLTEEQFFALVDQELAKAPPPLTAKQFYESLRHQPPDPNAVTLGEIYQNPRAGFSKAWDSFKKDLTTPSTVLPMVLGLAAPSIFKGARSLLPPIGETLAAPNLRRAIGQKIQTWGPPKPAPTLTGTPTSLTPTQAPAPATWQNLRAPMPAVPRALQATPTPTTIGELAPRSWGDLSFPKSSPPAAFQATGTGFGGEVKPPAVSWQGGASSLPRPGVSPSQSPRAASPELPADLFRRLSQKAVLTPEEYQTFLVLKKMMNQEASNVGLGYAAGGKYVKK